ncbi:TonB family protein [Chitinispirillales bacterium ANBcel5]|uniref:TonB family protein n=1 Tax=Cellulosispirillum alkaliphilum TaxID=3039283 RepID=UPI002A59560B|nr:TonB family protein [Chitinispirillales bacterium ANBcel5]
MKTLTKIALILLLIGFTSVFNAGLIDIRMEEVRYLLGSYAARQDVSNAFGIIARYEMIKKRMNRGDDSDLDALELEARIQALTSAERFRNEAQTFEKILYNVPVRTVLNSIRILLGKEIINPKEDDKIFNVIEIAYFWERNRKYHEAIKIYSDVLDYILPDETRAAVLVHKAFCYSMLNDYELAKKYYEKVISSFPETEAGIISWRLLEFIEKMQKQRVELESMDISGLDKARQFYLLMDYRSAIRHISIYLDNLTSKTQKMEARYYKARSHEELGETQEALIEYRRIIREAPQMRWAKLSNRRLLMLGEFYEHQKTVANEARRQLEAYQDQLFMRNIERYSHMMTLDPLREQLIKDEHTFEILSDDSILNLISKIGMHDTKEEEQKVATKNQTRSQRTRIQETSEAKSPEYLELKRRQQLSINPYRRPSFIKRIIDEHSPELRFIYNRHLRTEEKISGQMLVEMTIAADGTVTATRIVQSTMGDPNFEQNVLQSILKWNFRAVPDSLGELVINYPFEFSEN